MPSILERTLTSVNSGEEELFVRLITRPTKLLKLEVDTLASKLDEVASMALKMPSMGINGVNGVDGVDGKNGIDGKDGINGLNGKNGVNGKAGLDGKDGKDGISITDADISADDHLVLTLSDGNELDAGLLPSAQAIAQSIATVRTQPQIYVSPTPPSNPQLNDLWLQI